MGSLSERQHRLDLYLTHRAALIEFAAPIVGDRARAEDVVQEAWLRFGAAPAQERVNVIQPLSYLYRIVRNLAIDLSRRGAREVRGPDAEAILDLAPDSRPSPEAETIERDQLAHVVAALEALPERTRRAFHMHRFEGMTYAEIGRALGISVGSSHNLVSDAVARCMQSLLDGAA